MMLMFVIFQAVMVRCQQHSATNYKESPGLQYVMKIVESNSCIHQRELHWSMKNFASDECGAKIVGHSEEIEHPENVINTNHDQYLLNSCDKPSYFIIELCENIKIQHLELESFELYSGTPSKFSVYTADKLTEDFKLWEKYGSFQARSQKMESQTFSSSKPQQFARFVRLQLETFHGSELICTLTSIR